jgi:hypothetical protein
VFALYQAGARSGQPNLEAQLGRFQEACREVVRRVGLTPFEARPDESFDPARHQTPEDDPPPAADACIAQTLAVGYTFQGQLVRRSLVVVRSPGAEASVPQAVAQALPAASEGQVDSIPAAPLTATATTSAPVHSPSIPAADPRSEEQAFRLDSEPLTPVEDNARQA